MIQKSCILCKNIVLGYIEGIKTVLHKKKRGDGFILTMILVFFMITFTVTIGELHRVHMLQQDIEYGLQRAVNCAVEYAMGDSFRADRIVNLNVTEAKELFYEYLEEDMHLDSEHRKYKGGRVDYKLEIDNLTGTSNPAVLKVEGVAKASSLFSFLTGRIQIPFSIASTNYRLD